MTAAETKAALRAELIARRAREARQMPKAGEALAYRFPESLLDGRFKIASGFAPMKDEIEPGGVMARLSHAGASLALPCVAGKGKPLVFRAWAFGQPLVKRGFGVMEPESEAPEVTPDIVLAPLLGYDLQGGRLGYGAGYYDMTLAALRAAGPVVAVGLAYEISRVEALPMEPHDQRLDWIVTEAAAYEVFRD